MQWYQTVFGGFRSLSFLWRRINKLSEGETFGYELGNRKVRVKRLLDAFEITINNQITLTLLAGYNGKPDVFYTLDFFGCSTALLEVTLNGYQEPEVVVADALIQVQCTSPPSEVALNEFKKSLLSKRISNLVFRQYLKRKLASGTELQISMGATHIYLKTAKGVVLKMPWPGGVTIWELAAMIYADSHEVLSLLRGLIQNGEPEVFVTTDDGKVAYDYKNNYRLQVELPECLLRDENPVLVAVVGHYKPTPEKTL
jgi:hypothetical protein